jgi:hypothetical protein
MRHCVIMLQPSSELLRLATSVTCHTCAKGGRLARHLHQRRRVGDLHEINAWIVLQMRWGGDIASVKCSA